MPAHRVFALAGALYAGLLAGGPARAGTDPVPLWLWHSATLLGEDGRCAILLGVDSQGQRVQGMKLRVNLSRPDGRVIARNEIRLGDFGQDDAHRIGEGRWSDPLLCGEQLALHIEQAEARVLGKAFDLIGRQLLEIDDFKPMPIRVGKEKDQGKPGRK